MIWTTCKTELRLRYLDLRLPLILIVAAVFCTVTTLISCNHFEERVREYDAVRAQHRTMPSYLYGDASPNPLSIFCTGVSLKAPTSMRRPKMPYYGMETNVVEHPADNIIFAQVQYPDVAFVVASVVGLGALVFAYDSISGEKEKGTLKLAFSNRLTRYEFLLGKFLAGASGLSAVVLVVWLVSILLVTTESSVPLTRSDLGLLALAGLVSLLYILVVLAVTMLISSLVSSSRMALVCSVSFWLGACLLIPPLGPIAAKMIRKVPVYQRFVLSKHTLLKEETRGPIEACKKIKVESPDQAVEVLVRTINEVGTKWSKRNEELIADYQRRVVRQEDLSRHLCSVSPALMLQFALSEICGTSIHAQRDFVGQTEAWTRAFATNLWEKYGGSAETAFSLFGVQADQPEIRLFPVGNRLRHCLEYVVYLLISAALCLGATFVRLVCYDLR